jgi:hypothetical protein
MPGTSNRGLAFLFGILAAIVLILVGIVDFVGGFVFLALGSGSHALGAWSRSVVYVIVGLIFGLFAFIGHSGGDDRRIAAGVILVVLAVVGWFGLGFAGDLLALLAALFALISGILYLVAVRWTSL